MKNKKGASLTDVGTVNMARQIQQRQDGDDVQVDLQLCQLSRRISGCKLAFTLRKILFCSAGSTLFRNCSCSGVRRWR